MNTVLNDMLGLFFNIDLDAEIQNFVDQIIGYLEDLLNCLLGWLG